MKLYHKVVAFFAYLSGIIALLAVIVDDKKTDIYSFHVWQALFTNILIAIVSIPYAIYTVPAIIQKTAVEARPMVFIHLTLIPIGVVLLLLLILAILAACGVRFKIPILGFLANKVVEYRRIKNGSNE